MQVCNSDNHYTTAPTSKRMFKENLKQKKCLSCNQIRKRKRKGGTQEVISRVQTKDGYVTSTKAMTPNENSYDMQLTAVKRLKVQISHSDILPTNVFY